MLEADVSLLRRLWRLLLFPAGGRFKKEIVVDGQSHLLLIRDEGGPPEAQVSTAPLLAHSKRSIDINVF